MVKKSKQTFSVTKPGAFPAKPGAGLVLGDCPFPEISRLVSALPAVALQHWNTSGRCLNGTRVVIDALAKLGLPAAPMLVNAIAFNSAGARLFKERGSMPATEAEALEWKSAGAHVVGIDRDRAMVGHLVAITGGGWLIDSAVGQFHRPAKGICVPEALAFVAAPGLHAELPNGCAIIYEPLPDDASFEDKPGFQRTPSNLAAVRDLERAMRGGAL